MNIKKLIREEIDAFDWAENLLGHQLTVGSCVKRVKGKPFYQSFTSEPQPPCRCVTHIKNNEVRLHPEHISYTTHFDQWIKIPELVKLIDSGDVAYCD